MAVIKVYDKAFVGFLCFYNILDIVSVKEEDGKLVFEVDILDYDEEKLKKQFALALTRIPGFRSKMEEKVNDWLAKQKESESSER